MSFLKIIIAVLIAVAATLNIFSCGEKPIMYDGEFLEKRLALSYKIDGVLTQNGEQFDVIVNGTPNIGAGELVDFKIEFTSGDVTNGILVEFFDNGVFLYFDDLRFKTNSELFTNLEALKLAFEKLGQPYTEKYVTDILSMDGANLIEIGISPEQIGTTGDIKAFVNKTDGAIIRLTTSINNQELTLDIKSFENVLNVTPEGIEEETNPVFDVVDDYVEIKTEAEIKK